MIAERNQVGLLCFLSNAIPLNRISTLSFFVVLEHHWFINCVYIKAKVRHKNFLILVVCEK